MSDNFDIGSTWYHTYKRDNVWIIFNVVDKLIRKNDVIVSAIAIVVVNENDNSNTTNAYYSQNEGPSIKPGSLIEFASTSILADSSKRIT
jgi:hypothetical protein